MAKKTFWGAQQSSDIASLASTRLDASAMNADAPQLTRSLSPAETVMRRLLPDMYFVNTPGARVARHYEVLQQLGHTEPHEQPLLLFHETPGVAMSELTFCAWDESAPGLLSKLCGTLAALNLSIHTAFVYTFRDTGNVLQNARIGNETGWIALDTFLVSERVFRHERPLSLKTQKRVQNELRRVLNGDLSVLQLLQKARRRPLSSLEVLAITCENRPQDPFTRLSLRAQDQPGVLYRTTSALAQMNLSIRAAQISTRDEAANDIFFLSDLNGDRLPDAQLPALIAQLRARLQDNASNGG